MKSTKIQIKLSKKIISGIIVLATFFFSVNNAHATHAAGADLTYTCLGGNQYRIEVTFYRDCGGVAEPNSISVNYKSTSLGQNLNVTANKISGTGQEITVPCASSASTCNGGTSVGIRKFVYQATVTLPAAATDWKFSYKVCCRNCAITSIMSPCASTTEIYVESTLNNVAAPGNSSPLFSNIPVAFVCSGQSFNYNHGVSDINGDSLAYEFIAPKISETNNVTFVTPFTATAPFGSSTPFTLNPLTGQISFTPNMIQVGIMAIRIKEYRNGVLIGTVIRDMEVFTTACSNNLPTASGINNTSSYSMTTCANQQVCFNVNSADADAAQNVTVTTNQGIAAGTYTISAASKPVLNFCWTPTLADIDLSPQTFTVTVQDNACPNNGVQTFSYSINVVAPNFTINSNNVSCNGLNNGSATAVPMYAGPQTYLWSNGATTAAVNNLAPANYTVTLTNTNGCTISKSVTITQPTILSNTLSQTNISCAGLCNGAVNATVAGGTLPYSYDWTGGFTTQNITGRCVGTYTVTVTDAKGCTTTKSAILTNVSNIAASVAGTNVICFGASSGSAILTLSGGVSPYAYLWSNGSIAKDQNAIATGTYTVTVTDGNSCTKTATVIITQPAAALNSNVTASINVSCFGNSSGSIDLAVIGGTAPYNYNWSNGSTIQDLNNIAAGTYAVTVTDANGCNGTVNSIVITQPSGALSSSVVSTSNVSCFGGTNGSINLSVNGGTSPYNYLWSNGSSTQNLTNVISGTYSVTVTDSKGCTTVTTGVQIAQPAAVLNSTVSATSNVSCFGGNNGSINLSVVGGTAPYTYNWSNGSSSQNLVNVITGIYGVTVTDAMGCTKSNSGLQISQPATSLSTSAGTISNVSCFGGINGAININVSGGTSPYSFLWTNGATTQNITTLWAGIYAVTITDSKGCTKSSAAVTITQPAASLAAAVNATADVLCFGGANGSITLNVNGGTSPYSFNWSNGASTQNLANIIAGIYTVTITDAKGCTDAVSGLTIGQPVASLNAAAGSLNNVSCYGNFSGDIDLNVTGGTAPFTYLWSNGMFTQDLNNVAAGTYSVTVTDDHGCTFAVNSIVITQPTAPLNANATTTSNVNCNSGANGAISLTVSGGTSPYSYNWSNGSTTQSISALYAGTYVVTVTDSKGCTYNASATVSQPAGSLNSTINTGANVSCFGGNNGAVNTIVTGGTTPYLFQWSNGATTQNITGLSSGSYSVTITDNNGCINVAAAVVNQPSAALSNVISALQNVSCFGEQTGAIDLTANGGTAPYTYLWSNNSTNEDQAALASGNYTVTITDAKGCTLSNAAISISQPAAGLNTLVASTGSVSCFGGNNGTIDLSVTGGTAPYNYNWSNGASTQDLTGLDAGNYSVIITDANGCTVSKNAINVSQPPAALSGSVNASANVDCYGGNNGSISLTISGGTAAYTYNWSNGATTQNLTGLIAGTYAVTVTDAKGCTKNLSGITISQPGAALNTLVNNVSAVSCNGGNNGNINLTVNGGTAPYFYQWSNGLTVQNVTGLSAGSYTVTVTDQKGCTQVVSAIAITQPGAALNSLVASQNNVSCFGGSNGGVNLTVSGGTSPYTYAWSNGFTTQHLNAVAAGNYSVVVTDSKGCTDVISAIVVAQPAAALSGNVSATTNVSCFGGNNGAINLTLSGGTMPYYYLWSNGFTTQNINSLASGTYTVSVVDLNGCTVQVTGININQPGANLTASALSTGNVNCFGGNNGNINLNVNGGTLPYAYQWNTGATTQSINNLAAGTYTATVTDAKGCVSNVTGITITQPAASLTANPASTTNVSCFGGNNGNINITANGGTLPYTFQWNNGSTLQNLNNLSSGTYSATITDANGCSTQLLGMAISEPVASLNANTSGTNNVSCFGGNNGNINLAANGGTAPYSYLWSNGSTTQHQSNLSSGNYTVTVVDIKGCSTQVTGIAINQPSAAVAANASSTTNVSCFGGNSGDINLAVSGGTLPYTFQWNNGATLQSLNNLISGTYTATVTDVNGCTTSVPGIVISQPAAAVAANPSSTSNVNCFGGNNGNINLTVSGGTIPYYYQWSNGSTAQNLTNVIAGTYSATVTDAKGCSTTVAGLFIDQPLAPLSANSSSISNVNCFGGSNGNINLTASGGTLPYSYLWNNGSTTQNLITLIAGVYSVTVTDANGCTIAVSAIEISEPSAPLSGSVVTTQNVNCNSGGNGSVAITASGGTAPYTVLWSNGETTQNISGLYSGTYVVTVTDAKGCTMSAIGIVSQPAGALSSTINVSQNINCYGGNNGSIALSVSGGTSPYTYSWSNGATVQSLINLSAGNYSVAITDANGCINVTSAIVTQPQAALSGSPSSTTNVFCYGGNNGNISLTINGGTAPYVYQWSNGVTTQNLSNLSSGTYTVTVADAMGCTTQVTGIAISQPAVALSANPSSTSNVSCFGGNNGNINLSINGGTVPYTYQWNNGVTTQNLINLAAGNYTATVTDANGCTTQVAGIAINQPGASIAATPSSTTNVSCYGGNNGDIILNVSGGTTPYTYQWNNGATTQNLNNLATGTYTATVTDANGCTTQVAGVTISQPGAAVAASPSSTSNVSCYGGNNGNINLTVSGGTAPYSYLWSNGVTTQHLINLSAGNYTATITDANGCTTQVAGIAINQPGASVAASASSISNVNCYGGNNGAISITVNGGTLPYTYQWNNGETTQNLSNLASGSYTVTVTDINGCTTQVSGIAINQPAAVVSANPSSTTNVNCFGGNNGTLNLTVSGGTTPYTYQWNNGATTQNLTGLSSGTYSVTVTDVNGCTTQVNGIAINQPGASVSATPSSTANVSCYGGNNGDISLTVNGGTMPYNYQWNNGSTTQNLTNLSAGTYSATVTDANGCTVQVAGIAVNQPGAAVSALPTSTGNVNCYGGNNGSIDIAVSGGTSPYSYQWNNGATTQNINNLTSGTYTATVTDINGCTTQVAGIAVNQPGAAIAASPSSTSNVSCFGGNNGTLNLTVNGGTIPYTYQWNNGATTQHLSGLSSGTYSVTVTDINGCTTQVAGIAINQPGAAVSAAPSSSGNVSCFGGNNGDIILNVNGGTLPYQYQWSNGATTQNIANLSAGSYSVTVTDLNGCTTQVSAIAINQPGAVVSATPASTGNVNCYGGNNGNIALAVNGGTAPYIYQWNNGETTQNLSNLSSGSYTATITDANGCTTQVAGIAINQPGASLSGIVSTTQNVSCNSGGNGSISFVPAGGTAPYIYLWSNGATTQNINSLYSGTYVVTVTDINNCVFSVAGIVSQPAGALASSINVAQNINCFGGNNGVVNINVNGGTLPYSYNWSNGETTQNLANLAAGNYSVLITDSNGCINIAYANVQQPVAALNGNPSSIGNVNCYGGNNGNIDLLINGGTSPYAYQWSNGETTQNISNLATGTYTATVTDANGCTTQVAGIAVNQPGASVSAMPASTSNVSCYGGNNGDINLTVNGGTLPYSYQWSNGVTTQNLSNLPSGTYSVTVTDINGCSTQVAGIAINQPGASVAASPLSTTNVSCYGGNNGDINLTVNGGTAPYTYQWSSGETTQHLINLSSGTYTVTVTDLNGCTTNVAGIAINQPGASLAASPSSTYNVSCYGGNNGLIDLAVNGGTAPYSFQWSNGETTQNLTNLSTGVYTATITDINGCTTQVAGIAINQPGASLAAAPTSTTNVSCYGGNNGDITLNVNGGTIPYSYQWSNGETTQNLSGLPSGTYTVMVTDSNGCTTQVAGIAINQPGASVAASPLSTTNVSCYGGNNGDISLTVNGGTAPYSYLWSSGETTQNLTNLSSGTYTVTVTDVNGCTTEVLGIAINQPGASVTAAPSSTNNVSCYGGSNGVIDLTVNGGTLPYAYQWNNGATTQNLSNLAAGTYTATVTDANGCTTVVSGIAIGQPAAALAANPDSVTNILCFGGTNGDIAISVNGGTVPYSYQWNNGNTLQNIDTLAAGNYSVLITDANGCTTQIAGIVVAQPDLLTATATFISGIDCFGGKDGEINLTINGGTAPYTFVWSNGATTQNNTYLPAGTYTATITDINGCSTVALGIVVLQPAAPLTTVIVSTQNIVCYGGSIGAIDITTSNGTAPYSYIWSNGLTTEDINNLSAGLYTVTVTDDHGCTTKVTVSINQPAAGLLVNGAVSNSNCLFGVTGSVNLNINGGTLPYTYLWNTGAIAQNLDPAIAGTYAVTVTDANGCSAQGNYIVTDNSSFNANASGPTEFCYGGSIILMADSVIAATYQWYLNGQLVTGANGSSYAAADSGSYVVTVTNACGSFSSSPIMVNVHKSDSIIVSPNVFVCPGESAQLNVTGGTSFEWLPATALNSNNIPDPIVTPLLNTIYTITVTNDYGCKTTDSVSVEIKCDTLIIPTGYSPNDDGVNDYFVIPGIDKYPGNKISIYNRWGSMVYEETNYNSKWGGFSNVSGLLLGKMVQPSTYFYVLDLNNNTKPLQGYIVIRY